MAKMHYLANSLHTIHLKKAFLFVLLPINFVLQLLKTRQNRKITFLEYSKVLLGTRNADLLSWIQTHCHSKSSVVVQYNVIHPFTLYWMNLICYVSLLWSEITLL